MHSSRLRIVGLARLIALAAAFGSSVAVAAAESPITRGKTCEEIGELYGFAAGKAMRGFPASPQDKVVVPDRCKNYHRLEAAIQAGLVRAQRLKK